MQSSGDYFLSKCPPKDLSQRKKKKREQPNTVLASIRSSLFSFKCLHIPYLCFIHPQYPTSSRSESTAIYYTLFFIKLRYFTIICTTFIPSNYSRQIIRKSRKIKHLSHFQALKESLWKAQAYEIQ